MNCPECGWPEHHCDCEPAKPGSLKRAGSAAALKQQVSKILMEALQGREPRYRLDGCIRWGLVEREIHKAIETAINEAPPNAPGERPGQEARELKP